jgi:acetolactate synthase-1/2/3 large subunit
MRIERAADIAPALKEALARREPVVLDIVTDENAYPPIGLFQKTSLPAIYPSV